jgi:hypothetical protein
MARPIKQTVEWFSHDANAGTGRTLSILYNHFQHEGVSAWWQLLERLCSTNNHFIDIRNPEDFEFLAAGMRFSPERLRAILDKIAGLSAIDVSLYRNGIIWSNNLVIRLSNVYKSRNQPLPVRPDLFNISGLSPHVNLKETPLLPKETPLLPKETPLLPKESTHSRESIETKERKRVHTSPTLKELFYSFKDSNGYKDIDFDNEFLKFTEYWINPPKRPKLACHNWLDKAVEYKKQREPKHEPDRYKED